MRFRRAVLRAVLRLASKGLRPTDGEAHRLQVRRPPGQLQRR